MRFISPAIAVLICSLFISCKDSHQTTNEPGAYITNPQIKPLASYPLKQHFKCLPKSAAIMAAHRGTARKNALSENSKQGLLALIDHGVLIAEIDVAQTKDGVHFLFHDGVWDDDSTGRGPVAAAMWKDAKKFLLNDTEGRLTSHTIISLDEYFKIAKDKIYLEIDFKSSANYRDVIDMIRQHDMADKVILIAYNNRQAEQLARLAPEILISMSVNDESDLDDYLKSGIKLENIAAWAGRDGPNKDLTSVLDKNNIPVLTYPSPQKLKSVINTADLIVTDYALDQRPIAGKYDSKSYKDCLSNQ